MALVEIADSDGSEGVKPRSRSSAVDKPKKSMKEDDPENVAMKNEGNNDEEGEDGEEEEEEYEIEAIIDAKRGKFKPGEYGYFVKWKGYGEEENSWVAESDAGNARELIDEYFKTRHKFTPGGIEKRPRPRPSKGGSGSTISRGKASSPTASNVSAATKRGRGKAKLSLSDNEDEEDDEPVSKAGKKLKKNISTAATTNGSSKLKTGSLSAIEKTEDDDVEMMSVDASYADAAGEDSTLYTTMKELNLHTMKSWEDLVVEVNTVERSKEGPLMVYFTTKTGQHVREPASKCAQHFPQKLIKFYESHLRWRMAEDDVEA